VAFYIKTLIYESNIKLRGQAKTLISKLDLKIIRNFGVLSIKSSKQCLSAWYTLAKRMISDSRPIMNAGIGR